MENTNNIPCKNCITFAICKQLYVSNFTNDKYRNEIVYPKPDIMARSALVHKCDIIFEWTFNLININDIDRDVVASWMHKLFFGESLDIKSTQFIY